MASTEFKVISWSPLDPVTDDKLDAMVSNDNWLRDNMVRGRYSGNGVKRSEGIRIASGLTLITASKTNTQSQNVSFSNYFSESCRPIVTTGILSNGHRQIFVTMDGPGDLLQPTRDGFNIHVYVNSYGTKQIARNFYVGWQAIGF